MRNEKWSREELILAFFWYCTKIPFSKISYTRPEVIELANIINRTPSAVSFKLVNFASLDPILQSRGIKGMSHRSAGEEKIWKEFYSDWSNLSYESELILSKYKNEPIEKIAKIDTSDLPRDGKEREAIVKTRVNQSFFRNSILLSYKSTCCITGINVPELLIASHIIPWTKDLMQGCNPENGLCLNALHDKAFDRGLITISDNYRIQVSEKLLKNQTSSMVKYFIPYHDKEITLPGRFLPNKSFLEFHRNLFS